MLRDPRPNAESPAPALDRGLRVLETLSERPNGCTFSELADAIGIPRASLHRIIATLSDAGYVKLAPASKRYHLGIKVFALGHAVFSGLPVLYMAKSELKALREESGETCEVWIPDGLALVLAIVEQARARLPQQADVGLRDFRNHSKAPGKVYLAFAGEELLEGYLRHFELTPFTLNTITDVDRLQRELRSIREQGYAVDREENRPGLCRIAAPIFNKAGDAEAFLTIAGPAFELIPEKDSWYGQMLCTYAERISRQLGWNPQSPH